jgi:hypothetical protein
VVKPIKGMVQPTAEQLAAMTLYAALLEEAKVRISSVEDMLNGKVALPGPLLHESCFLQLRFLCEIIALGCLVLHGDIKAPGTDRLARDGKLKKTWSADLIMEELSKLHPAFFPVAVRRVETEYGFQLVGYTEGVLSRQDLVQLYHLCGSHLHRGHLKKLLKSRTPTQFNFPDVLARLKLIGMLLSHHIIPLFEPGTLLLTILRNSDDHERVQVVFAAQRPTEGDELPRFKPVAEG